MNLELKKMAGGLILIIGLILFFSSLINNNLNLALVSLTSALILWVICSLFLDMFDVRIFAWVISLSGFLLALSVFFVFGIEEMPHPVGAVVFHAGGIAGSLGIGFFSLFPLLILYQTSSQNISIKPGLLINEEGSHITSHIESDDWELATEKELQSDDFEIG